MGKSRSRAVRKVDGAPRLPPASYAEYAKTTLTLAEREARLAAIFTHAAIGLSEVSLDGRFIFVNEALATMFGQSASRLIGTSLLEVTHPDDAERAWTVLQRVIKDGGVESLAKRCMRADGAIIDTHSTLTRLDVEDRADRIVVVTVETTERRQAERAQADSEEQYRLLVEGAYDYAMIMMNPLGIITAWNIGAERLLGWTEQEAIGQPGAIIFTPEDRILLAPEAEASTAAEHGRAEDERWHLRKDGSRFWGSGVMNGLRHADGSLRAYVKVMRDQTARREADELLRQSVEYAERANRVKDDFLATLSHELRTPLSAIMIWTKLLKSADVAEANRIEGLDAIQQSADAQKQLIDDLLDSSRITSGKLRLEMTDVPLVSLMRSAVDAIGPTAQAKGIKVAFDLDEEAGVVRADPDRLRQIVWNLLTNAVKFTPAGGTISVGMWRRGSDVEIQIADTGRGIEKTFLPHVFVRFSQSDPASTRTSGGLGLGLAIVKQLVELHGGTISVDSKGPNTGATFRVLLPLRSRRKAPPTPPRQKPAAAAVEPPVLEGSLSGVHILLVEDQPMPRAAIKALLNASGATVEDVGTAAEAINSLARRRPQLLLSDIGLPEMDGHALIRQIRAEDAAAKRPHLLAMALTAFAGEEDDRAARDAGYDRYMSKPFTSESLIAMIESMTAAS